MAASRAVLTLYLGAGASEPWVIAAAADGRRLGSPSCCCWRCSRPGLQHHHLHPGRRDPPDRGGAASPWPSASRPNPWAVNEIINWLMGSLADRSLGEVQLAAPLIAVGCVLLMFIGRGLDALTLGETGARSLGVNMTATRWLLAIGVALTAGASVAVTGVIGFVGLIVPHLLRPLVGARPGGLLAQRHRRRGPGAGRRHRRAPDPGSGRVKLGVAMAVLGGPFFFALLLNLRRRIA